MSKKRIISAIGILLASVLVIMGAGKLSRESKDYAAEFIEEFYTITDYETYSYARANPYANVYTADRLARENYSSYFTEEGMDEFISDGVQQIFEEMVYSMNCTSRIGEITLEKVSSDTSERSYTYDFDVTVIVTDTNGNDNNVEQHGTVSVSKKNEMKITSFKVIDSMSVIRAVSSMY